MDQISLLENKNAQTEDNTNSPLRLRSVSLSSPSTVKKVAPPIPPPRKQTTNIKDIPAPNPQANPVPETSQVII